jgi:hypothetical protein
MGQEQVADTLISRAQNEAARGVPAATAVPA